MPATPAATPFATPAVVTGSPRFDRVDALRGAAIVWMAAFHFTFDLNHFGFVRENFYSDPFWTWQRACIVSLFLFCAGLGQALAMVAGQSLARFGKRWLQIAGCALLVSAGSWWMFPDSLITFGVLHGIAVMLLVARLLAAVRLQALGWWLLGAAALLLPLWFRDPVFDSRWTNWVGLVTRKPVTEDWVPLLPWLGAMLWGVAAGRWLLKARRGWLAGALPAPLRPLALLGRWSLSFYMLHQPVLIGLLTLVSLIAAASPTKTG